MKFKLDENFGSRTQELFRDHGHEVQTVRDEGLQGCSDQHLFQVCCAERYCLVTLDLDFSDVTRFPPGDANGVVVIRVPQNPRLELPEQLVRQCLEALSRGPLEERLWVVEVNRIRVHQIEAD